MTHQMSDASPNTPAVVVPFLNTRMTEAAYDFERAKLRELYGDSSAEASAKRDQALAVLFYRSGWTQEELAKKEGKSQRWIAYRLCFGRFLNFSTMVLNPETLPNSITERRFRSFWERTEGSTNERARFQDVIGLMQDDADDVPATGTQSPPKVVGQAIKKACADGKWHNLTVIAGKIELDEDRVRKTLDSICSSPKYGCKAEKKLVGTGVAYRLFKLDRAIPAGELLEKLSPILDGLEAEGKKTMATMAPAAVAILAHKLRKLLKEWTE